MASQTRLSFFAVVVNLSLTPVDVALIPFFMYLGGWIFQDPDTQNFSVQTFMEDMGADTMGTLVKFQRSLVFGVISWLICLPLIVMVIYLPLVPIFKRVLPPVKQE